MPLLSLFTVIADEYKIKTHALDLYIFKLKIKKGLLINVCGTP